jgi:hypothetical protein
VDNAGEGATCEEGVGVRAEDEGVADGVTDAPGVRADGVPTIRLTGWEGVGILEFLE